jgi:hypothetical protein
MAFQQRQPSNGTAYGVAHDEVNEVKERRNPNLSK